MPEMYAVFVQGSGGGDGGAGFAPRPVTGRHGAGAYLADPTRWGAWAHRGHRLWASMSEEFWVYVYKVQRCPQQCSHDWTACPYAHKGERARRRDPCRFSYAGVSCPDYRAQLGATAAGGQPPPACVRGLKCRYAHGVFELWLHPSRFRTRMCEAGQLCPRPICFFAHSPAELRREDAAVATPPSRVVLQRAAAAPPHATTTTSPPAAPAPHPRDGYQFDLTTSVHATPPDRSTFRVYYDHAGASSSSSFSYSAAVATADVDAPTTLVTFPDVDGRTTVVPVGGSGFKCSRCTEEEDSMVHDYPHVDLIMDLVEVMIRGGDVTELRSCAWRSVPIYDE